MQQLKWDELEVLECLAVLPEVDEDSASQSYNLSDGVLSLLVTLWHYESVAQFTLSRTGTDEVVTHFALAIRDGIYYRNEKSGEALEFRDCIVVPIDFYRRDLEDVFDRGLYPKGVNMELFAHPFIRLLFNQNQ